MRNRLLLSALTLTLALSVGVDLASAQGRGGGRGRGGGGLNIVPLTITSPAFEDGGIVPPMYAGRGGVSPELNWTGAPEGVASYAIIFHDIDVVLNGTTEDVLHWIVWNIPGDATGIPEGGLPDGSVVGSGTFGQSYFGPGAPAGERYHHYVFELFGLNTMLDLPATAGRNELLEAMSGNIVAKAAYVGRFHQ
jgi:Raf kinase inhibitor-like YbhB/YbcL family protein